MKLRDVFTIIRPNCGIIYIGKRKSHMFRGEEKYTYDIIWKGCKRKRLAKVVENELDTNVVEIDSTIIGWIDREAINNKEQPTLLIILE